jgi:uracil-DNA glycosylase
MKMFWLVFCRSILYCFIPIFFIGIPPSLQNMFKELQSDIPKENLGKFPLNGSLDGWAKQGILLLNTALTVRARSPDSHSTFGTWKKLREKINVKSDEKF